MPSILYKTKMCHYKLAGNCKHGPSCLHAHSPDELRERPDFKKTKLCVGYRKGLCPDVNCSHAHGEQEVQKVDEFYKKKLCKYYLGEGSCIRGPDCYFAHSEAEIRSGGSLAPGPTPLLPAPSTSPGNLDSSVFTATHQVAHRFGVFLNTAMMVMTDAALAHSAPLQQKREPQHLESLSEQKFSSTNTSVLAHSKRQYCPHHGLQSDQRTSRLSSFLMSTRTMPSRLDSAGLSAQHQYQTAGPNLVDGPVILPGRTPTIDSSLTPSSQWTPGEDELASSLLFVPSTTHDSPWFGADTYPQDVMGFPPPTPVLTSMRPIEEEEAESLRLPHDWYFDRSTRVEDRYRGNIPDSHSHRYLRSPFPFGAHSLPDGHSSFEDVHRACCPSVGSSYRVGLQYRQPSPNTNDVELINQLFKTLRAISIQPLDCAQHIAQRYWS